MADAHGSGPCARKGVRVQLPPSPQYGTMSRSRSGPVLGPGLTACGGRGGETWGQRRSGLDQLYELGDDHTLVTNPPRVLLHAVIEAGQRPTIPILSDAPGVDAEDRSRVAR